jgi:hypothetical protein
MKILQRKLVFPPILVVNWVSSCLSFFLSAFSAARYIFTAPTCTTTIISLEPCALNAKFQHFILRFNKISLVRRYHWKTGYGVKTGPKTGRQGDFLDNCIVYKNFFIWSWNPIHLMESLHLLSFLIAIFFFPTNLTSIVVVIPWKI